MEITSPGAQHQMLEDAVLETGQLDRGTVQLHGLGARVEHDRAALPAAGSPSPRVRRSSACQRAPAPPRNETAWRRSRRLRRCRPSTLSCQRSRAVRIRTRKLLPRARSRRMSSSPDTFGSPRSMIATSIGYSSPAYTPSSPSRGDIDRVARGRQVAPSALRAEPPRLRPPGCACWPLTSPNRLLPHSVPLAASTCTVQTLPESSSSLKTYTVRPLSRCDSALHHAGAVPLLDHLHRLVHGDLGVGHLQGPPARRSWPSGARACSPRRAAARRAGQ